MSLAVLQLNDLNLFIQTDQGQTYSEAGYALLTDEGITTGDKARSNTWLQPQNAYNQYWDQLNQTPLAVKHTHARHHADIAYAQLKHLLQSVGNPKQLILSVPGHITDQQLSLLLGLLKALEVELIGIIDSSLAASVAHPKAQFIVEVQLYQTVVTAIDRKQNHIEILKQRCLPDLGITHLYNQVAGHISNQLIDQYRYDPLHSSVAEQLIHDLIPNWLLQLSRQPEINAQIESPQGELGTVVKTQAIAQLFSQRLDSLKSSLKGVPETIYFSQDASFIPNLVSHFGGCSLLDGSVISNSCLQLAKQFPKDRLERATTISLCADHTDKSTALSTPRQAAATHVLYNNNAYPIHKPISISRHGGELIISSKMDKDADVVIAPQADQLQVINQQADLQVKLPASIDPGQSMWIDDQPLILIGVNDG